MLYTSLVFFTCRVQHDPFMESSNPSGKTSEPPSHRWANLLGTMIAILTLTLPLLAIGYNSTPNYTEEPLTGKTSYSLTRQMR